MARASAVLAGLLGFPASAPAQFLEEFDGATLAADAEGLEGWSWFAGDGMARIDLVPGGRGYASIRVDATADRRGIWWALVKRRVSHRLDLERASRPGQELRIEARIRASHAPRRVNLHLNTRRTTDFHSHLMEFDIPDTDAWHTISMTTRDFDVRPGDTVFAQLALMDWGLETYRVDLDYLRVDVVDPATAGPDQGAAVPYHPPVPDPGTFSTAAPVAHDAVIDRDHPDVNLNGWQADDAGSPPRLLAVGGTLVTILRFDLGAFRGRRVAGHGLLELTTRGVERTAPDIKDFGLVRVVEVLGGDPAWDQRTVTAESLCRGQPLDRVLNSQMIIDWPVTPGDGSRTRFTISRPVLQRLVDGRTLGLALRPLGSLHASFYAVEHEGGRFSARLLFDLDSP